MTGSCDKFIKKAKEVHGDRYDYINTKYLSSKTKVEIICNEHGSFIQSPAKHISGRGCPECAKIKRWDTRGRMNFDYFILSAKKIHQSRHGRRRTLGSVVKLCFSRVRTENRIKRFA